MGTCTAVLTCTVCHFYSQWILSFFSSSSLSLSPQVVGLNFSSATTPELLLKTFDHYCEYKRTPNRVIMAPAQLGKWLVLFCDGINLPDLDKYGEREGRDKTREGQERREEDCELRVREGGEKQRKK